MSIHIAILCSYENCWVNPDVGNIYNINVKLRGAQLLESLPRMHETLGLIPSTT